MQVVKHFRESLYARMTKQGNRRNRKRERKNHRSVIRHVIKLAILSTTIKMVSIKRLCLLIFASSLPIVIYHLGRKLIIIKCIPSNTVSKEEKHSPIANCTLANFKNDNKLTVLFNMKLIPTLCANKG